MKAEDIAARKANRRQWHYLLAFSAIVVVALAAITYSLWQDQQRQQDNIAEIVENEKAAVENTLLGCQRGNELRRAVRQLQAEFTRDCPLCRVARLDIDPDATVIDDCRATVEVITGIELPPDTSSFVE